MSNLASNSAGTWRNDRGVIGAVLCVAAYLTAAAIAAIVSGNREFVFYIVVMAVLTVAVAIVHFRVRLSTPLLWALAIWGGLHMAGGLVPVPESWPINGEIRVLYSWWVVPREGGGGWLKFDHIVHAYGFATATWLCWEGVCGATGRQLRPTFGLMFLVTSAGCGLGALNEIIEFIATRITTTNVGGYDNTGWDLISNAVGAAIAATIIGITKRNHEGNSGV